MRAVITAGGTSEPIDDVRVITNVSTGRFGAALANELARRGVQVTLLAGRALAGHPEWMDRSVRVVPFGGAAELDERLGKEIERPPELLFMAAAVSDYTPRAVEGKIRSDQDELVLRLTRNPKILGTLRERCGVGTFLVGFKLLSHVSREELVETARRMVERDRLNLCVANDLAELSREEHPLWLVTPEGGAVRCEGSKAVAAAAVVDFALKRASVRWHRSARVEGEGARGAEHGSAVALLRAAVASGMLPGRDGNVSVRASAGLWITPRGADKSALTGEELVWARVDPKGRRVSYVGGAKPSIDTAVHAAIYEAMPEVRALVHTHEAIAVPTATTGFPYPCGTVEEAEEIRAAMAEAAWRRRYTGGGFSVRLVHHGLLVGLNDPGAFAARSLAVMQGYAEHIREVGAHLGASAVPARQVPVLRGGEVIGVSASFVHGGGEAWSTWLTPEARGAGSGDEVLEAISETGRQAIVADRCEVLSYYAERGWKVLRHEGGLAWLMPPSARADLVPAASVCLVDPVRRMVLIGERRTEPWRGYFAFPGGRVEAGEGLLEAALRELAEETGIVLSGVRPLRERRVVVGSERAFVVTNFLLPVFHLPQPEPSEEIVARWVSIEEASRLRPMAAGTRRILRELVREGQA